MTEFKFPPIPSDEFVVYADLFAKEGQGDEVERYLRVLIKLAESEPGTLEYALSRDDQNPLHFHCFERYAGKKAFQDHIGTKEFQEFVNSGCLA